MYSAHCNRAVQGWLAGCAAATAALGAYALLDLVLTPATINTRVAFFVIFLLPLGVVTFLVTGVLTGIPAAIIIWLSEKFHIRSILLFGCAGAAIGGLTEALLLRVITLNPLRISPLFVMAGLVAGLAYWHVAGKHAGEGRSGDRS